MEFIVEKWKIKNLLDLLNEGKLDLNPPYQRNPIWTKSTQKYLINSIRKSIPIPNIFLFQREDGTYEMVDGQQRTRAIKLYESTKEIDLTVDDADFKNKEFLTYELPVTIITKIEADESIEDFYYMVNTSGVKLNRPEELKAHYFQTNFLKLVEELTKNSLFQQLNIIPNTSQKRMMDRDLVEELCALILFGITDKKSQVNKIYESDLKEEDINLCRSKFLEIVNRLISLDTIFPLKNTRYRQRNDFYTLFGFIKDNLGLNLLTIQHFYKVLLQLERGIRPSKSACSILAEYAFNCVSQSNSSKARQTRVEILNSLLLNNGSEPTSEQIEVQRFYPIEGEYFIRVDSYLTFDDEILRNAISTYEENNQII